jgi:hypothetical protein
MNSPQSPNAGSRFFSAFRSPLGAAALAILAIVVILMNAGNAAAPSPAPGSASVTIAGPLPVPVTGTVKIDSSENTVHVAAPTLFRLGLYQDGPYTNTTAQTLVIEFVNGDATPLASCDCWGPLELFVSAPDGTGGHQYEFVGVLVGTGFAYINQPTKIIVKPGEKVIRLGYGVAEITGHYE